MVVVGGSIPLVPTRYIFKFKSICFLKLFQSICSYPSRFNFVLNKLYFEEVAEQKKIKPHIDKIESYLEQYKLKIATEAVGWPTDLIKLMLEYIADDSFGSLMISEKVQPVERNAPYKSQFFSFVEQLQPQKYLSEIFKRKASDLNVNECDEEKSSANEVDHYKNKRKC
jgi:hypothetical protein